MTHVPVGSLISTQILVVLSALSGIKKGAYESGIEKQWRKI